MKYKFFEDPGHGWLEVPISEIDKLHLRSHISRYSYMKNDKAYLEEDCDMSVFLRAKEAAGEPVEYSTIYEENTPIRNYDNWEGA